MKDSRAVRKAFVQSTMWSSLGAAGAQAVQFLTTLVLARLLVPQAFGVVAMANTVTLLVGTLNQLGISPSLVQRQDLCEEHLSSAFWLNIAVGIVLGAATFVAAKPVGRFYGNDLVAPVLAWLAVTFPISATKVVHTALLTRALRYRALFVANAAEAGVNGVVSIALACAGWEIWSLVIGRIAGLVAGSVASFLLHPWRPRLSVSMERIRELMRFGLFAMGSSFLSYFIASADNIVVGHSLGAVALGSYALAYSIVTLPQKRLSSVIAGVAFPILSRIQDDPEIVARSYLRMLGYISFVTFPALAGLAAVAPEFVEVVLGARWSAVTVPMQLLCLAGALRSVLTTVGSVFYSKGKPEIGFRLDFGFLLLLYPMLLLGVRWGTVGVAATVTIFDLVIQGVNFRVVARLLDVRLGSVYRAMGVNFAMSAAMFLVIWALSSLLRGLGAPSVAILVVTVATGLAVYTVLALLLQKELLLGFLNLAGLDKKLSRVGWLRSALTLGVPK